MDPYFVNDKFNVLDLLDLHGKQALLNVNSELNLPKFMKDCLI